MQTDLSKIFAWPIMLDEYMKVMNLIFITFLIINGIPFQELIDFQKKTNLVFRLQNVTICKYKSIIQGTLDQYPDGWPTCTIIRG